MSATIKEEPKKYLNPLRAKRVRKFPCPCGSGKTVKNCHARETYVPLHLSMSLGVICKEGDEQFFQAMADHVNKTKGIKTDA